MRMTFPLVAGEMPVAVLPVYLYHGWRVCEIANNVIRLLACS